MILPTRQFGMQGLNGPNKPNVGLNGPTGQFLYDWSPNWALSVVCDNAAPADIISGSACDLYLKQQTALYPPPPMPPAPPVPQNLPDNPADKASAQAAIDAIIAAQAAAQKQQTEQFFEQVTTRLDQYEQQRAQVNESNKWGLIALGLIAFTVLVVWKR